MMVNFDFLSKPIILKEDTVEVLCVENQKLFRKICGAFINGELEENNIVFSDKYIPFKFKGNICVINDYFSFSYSSAITKKIYEHIESYCNEEHFKETLDLKTHLVNYMESIIKSFDYDFDFNYDISLTEIFKMMNLTSNLDKSEVLRTLLDYILILNKYAPPKCFVLLNLHLYFTIDEIELFYRDVLDRRINLLILENTSNFKKSDYENVLIYDDDFCEIVED